MIQKIKAPVSVNSLYDHKKRLFRPLALLWEGKTHKISTLGYHHAFRSGKTLFHVFSVASDSLFFKLSFNTEFLSWELEEVSDEEAD